MLNTITVHGEILAPVTNTPAVGTVTFKILEELRDNGDDVIYAPQTFVATLDVNGEFSIDLPVTDQADVTPLNWSYWVYVDTDIWVSGVFYIQLPEVLGPVVEFSDLIEISPTGSDCTPDGTPCAPIGALAALQDEIDALEVQMAEVLAGFEELEQTVDDLEAQVDALAALVATFSGDITDLQADVAALQSDVASLNTTVSALVGQVNTISPIVFANQAAITTIQGQITTIQGQITTIQGQITTLQGQVATNTANIATNTANIATNTANIATNTASITTIQGQITTIQTNITTLQGQVGTLQTDLTNLTTRVTTLEGNAVLKNPVSGAVYVGNQIIGPQATGTVPWLSNSSNPIPHSPGDSNFDFTRVIVIDEFGNQVQAFVLNGNAELRTRPSTRARIGNRAFESAEAVGFSTGQYVQWSSNPTVTANREPYLGGWGSASAKPGWVEATRVLSGLLGVSIGGTANATLAPYNTLSAFNYRGLKGTAGAPAAGTWLLNDVILDSIGVVWRCTVAGTPGTWVAAVPGTSIAVGYVGAMGNAATITDGAAGSGAPYAVASTYSAADNRVWLDGSMANNGGVAISAQTTLFTIDAAHRPASWVQFPGRTSTNLAVRITVKGATGAVCVDQSMAAGATLAVDGVNWRKA